MENDPRFVLPENQQVKLWRYMDFTKFIAMLESNALFFSRADLLGDPFEGSLSTSTLDQQEALRQWNLERMTETEDEQQTEEIASRSQNMRDSQKMVRERNRKWMFINCWHMNEHESAAMWSKYASSDAAIAIQSTYVRLSNNFEPANSDPGDKPHIGVVQYIDFQIDPTPGYDLLHIFMFKRKSFQYENELRVIFWNPPIIKNVGIDYNREAPIGLLKKVDLVSLLECVYISPNSPDWYKKLVQDLLKRYSLPIPVKHSSLAEDPRF